MMSKSYGFRYIQPEQRYILCESDDDTKVNEILSYFSETYDKLCDTLPNLLTYGSAPSDYGRKIVEEAAILETKQKFELYTMYYILDKKFSELTKSRSFSLSDMLPESEMDAIV